MMSISAVVMLCVSVAMTAAGAQANVSTADESAIRDVVKRYVDARETRDPARIAALFTPDADQLTSSGEWRRGREALVKGALASSQANAGRRTISVDAIRVVAPGVALADGAYSIAEAKGGARNMRTSFVLVRSEDGWKISAIRNMLPAPQ